MLFYGGVGRGKTHYAACIANALTDQSVRVRFTDLPKIVNQLQASFEGRARIYDELREVPLLILDDFRSERTTEFMQEVAFEVVNGRAEAHKPLIVTTNLTANELKAQHDISTERIFSRIRGMTVPVEIEGTDKRRERIKTEYADDLKLLGLK